MASTTVIMFPGMLSSQKDANAAAQQICDKLKFQAEQQAGRKFGIFTAKFYKTHTMGIGIVFIKVHVGGGQYAHLRIYQKQPGDPNPELKGIQYPKTLDDHIVIF
ncbi:cystatin-B-like [Clarias magur]|uniref:Cystatin-B-like n=1 Tax=Clarias magur TaxID=1594786 RepID=A0A8J4URL3_CLAMG|nr:cystatin-B-like [Clarias magur]